MMIAPCTRPEFLEVSVIVPTRNRARFLLRLLDALRAQTFPADRFEVLPVVNATEDDTMEQILRFDTPFALRPIETDAPGAASARNRGASEAQADLLLFLDDDVIPSPGLIEAHASAHDTAERFVGIGPYYPVHLRTVDFFRIATRNWWEDLFMEMGRPDHRFTYRDVLSGNLSMRADLFRALGGFARDFAACDGEDWELGVRVVRRGVPVRFLPEARAHHLEHETMTLERSFVRARREGRGDARISRRFPELEPALAPPWGKPWDLSRRRAPVLLARCAPRTCEAPARALARLLPLLEGMRMRRSWKCVYHFIRGYWRWRGYFEEMRAIRAERDSGTPSEETIVLEETTLLLDEGIEEALRRVDRERPSAVRIIHGGRAIGTISAVPGAEPLRGAHLRRILGGALADTLAANGEDGDWSR